MSRFTEEKVWRGWAAACLYVGQHHEDMVAMTRHAKGRCQSRGGLPFGGHANKHFVVLPKGYHGRQHVGVC